MLPTPVFRSTDTVPDPGFATTTSSHPSPSTSPVLTVPGATPVPITTPAPNEPASIVPFVAVFRITVTEFPPTPLTLFATTTSTRPSPSQSPTATPAGLLPVT